MAARLLRRVVERVRDLFFAFFPFFTDLLLDRDIERDFERDLDLVLDLFADFLALRDRLLDLFLVLLLDLLRLLVLDFLLDLDSFLEPLCFDALFALDRVRDRFLAFLELRLETFLRLLDLDLDLLFDALGVFERLLADLDLDLEDLGVFDLLDDLRLRMLTERDAVRERFAAFGVLDFLPDLLREAFGVLLLRLVLLRLGVADFLALGVLARLTDLDLDLDALGVLERRLDRLRLGVADFSALDLGALGVLARFTDRDFEALGVLDRRFDRLLEDLTFSALDFGALGVLARRLFDLETDFEAFGVFERRLERLFDFLLLEDATFTVSSALGALGVLARRLVERLLLLDALGVFDRRRERLRLGVFEREADLIDTSLPASDFGALGVLARRETERLLEAFGVLLLRLDDLDRLRFGVADFSGTDFLGAFGVLALLLTERDLDAFGVLERRFVERQLLERDLDLDRLALGAPCFAGAAPSPNGALGVFALRLVDRFLEAFGVLERRLVRLRLGVADFFALDFGAFGVLALREAVFFFEALGVLLLRLDLLLGVADLRALALGAFGVLARLRLLERDLDALGVRLRLFFLERLRLGVADFEDASSFIGAFGVLARRLRLTDRDLEDFGVRLRRLVLRLLGVADFSALDLGAFGVLALRDTDRERDFEDLGVLDLRRDLLLEDLREALLDALLDTLLETELLGALGVLARLLTDLDLDFEDLGVLDLLDLLEDRRLLADLEETETERDLEAFGVFDLLAAFLLELLLLVERPFEALGVLARLADLFLAFGVLERRLALRFPPLGVLALRLAAARLVLELLGVLDRRFLVERLRDLLGALGVLARRADLRLEALGVLDRFCFLDGFMDLELSLFLLPISLFLLASISALY